MARTKKQIQAINRQLAKNAEYWQERFARLEKATHLSAEGYVEELDKQYKLANKSIKDKLASFYAQFADSEGISLAAAKKLLTDDQLAEFHMSVEEYIKMGEGPNNMDPDVQKKLERASIKYRVTRLEAIDTELAAELEQLRLKNQDIAYSAVSNAYRERYYRSIYEIQKGIGVGSTFSKVDESRLHTILDETWVGDGLNFSDRIWKNKNTLYNELSNNLSQALILGQGYSETSEKFQQRMGTSFSNAARVIVTESAYYASAAQEESFKDLGVEKYEIVATLDHVTSEICRYMDGKVFKMSEFKAGVTAPPFHPNCRTSTCPHFDDSDLEGYTVGERAARNDPEESTYYVPADLNYDEWYDQYVLKSSTPAKSDKVDLGGFKGVLDKPLEDVVVKQLDQAPADMKTIWNYCAKDFSYGGEIYTNPVTGKRKKGTLYSPYYRQTFFNQQEALAGTYYEKPGSAVFHENGHHMDHLLSALYNPASNTTYGKLSSRYNNGEFYKTLNTEFADNLRNYFDDFLLDEVADNVSISEIAALDRRRKIVKQTAARLKAGEIEMADALAIPEIKELYWKKHQDDIADIYRVHIINQAEVLFPKSEVECALADISDMFEAVTTFNPNTTTMSISGIGHGGRKYWMNGQSNNYAMQATEAFAEMYDATVNSPSSLTMIQLIYPKSYQIFLDMISFIIGLM